MAKKRNEKIVETEPITSAEEIEVVNEPEVMEVEAPKMPEFKKLICKSPFTDKFDHVTEYKVGDELNITDTARRNDLIKRGLAAEE